MDFDEDPDEQWVEDDADPEDDVLACPACRNDVHEDTQQCPHCGEWIIPVYPSGRSRRLVWIVVAVLLILGLVALTIR